MVAAASVAASLLSPVPSAQADPTLGPSTWIHNSSDSTLSRAWTNGANWSTAPDHPSGVGAIAIINDDPDNNRNFSFTPTGTTADPVPPGQPLVTLGSLTVNNSSQYTNNFTSGSNQVFLDAAGDGPAQINLLGNATSSGVPNSLNAIFSFTDSVVITVDKTSSGSSLGDANFNGIYQGTGGLTKAGLGTATITNGSGVTKTYSGPTIVEAGRLRIGTQSGSPGAPLLNTSNISVASNAQLDLGPNAATFLFGTSSATPININGTGIQPGTPIGGTYGSSGAIRANTNITLQNNIVVQSNDATITANATGGAATLTLNGIISGDAGNRLQFGGFGNAPDGGRVILTADNTYAGGTNITRGIVEVSGANADLGAGDVFVDGASWLGPDPTIWGLAAGQLSITSGVLNAIDDTATLSLTGDTATYGGLGDGAVGGIATLGAGIEELIGGLVLGGITQTAPGTYGSTASGATFQDDRYFAGAGVVSLVPEPSSLAIIGLGAACLLRRRSR
jgi:autotransporter-associated beta strand protein